MAKAISVSSPPFLSCCVAHERYRLPYYGRATVDGDLLRMIHCRKLLPHARPTDRPTSRSLIRSFIQSLSILAPSHSPARPSGPVPSANAAFAAEGPTPVAFCAPDREAEEAAKMIRCNFAELRI